MTVVVTIRENHSRSSLDRVLKQRIVDTTSVIETTEVHVLMKNWYIQKRRMDGYRMASIRVVEALRHAAPAVSRQSRLRIVIWQPQDLHVDKCQLKVFF